MSIEPTTLLALVDDRDLLDELRRRGVDLSRLRDKPCGFCGALFTPRTNQRYCCPEHRREASKGRGSGTSAADRRAYEARWRDANRGTLNAYHRWYQKGWRERMTEEQKERHRAQKRAYTRRKAAGKRAPKERAA